MRLTTFLLIALWSSITAAEDFLELEIQNGQVVSAYTDSIRGIGIHCQADTVYTCEAAA